MYDVTKFLGTKWAVPCDWPLTADCWELVYRVRADMGRPIPRYVATEARLVDTAPLYTRNPPKGWKRLCAPALGAIAVLGADRLHVGIVVGRDRVFHVADNMRGGGTARIDRLRLLNRIYNNELRFYDYAPNNC